MAVSEHRERLLWRPTLVRRRSLGWVARYQWQMVAADAACGVAAGLVALLGRFAGSPQSALYVVTTAGLPLIWIAWVGIAGGYDPRLIGLGSEEFRRIINAAFSLTAAIAIVSYAVKVDFARGYVLIALPGLGAADTAARYLLRKRLHRQRERGLHMRRVTAVGHAGAVADLIAQLRRDRFHGLEVVNAWTGLCDAAAAFPATQSSVLHKWVNYTGCDSLYSTAADANGAYFGGHERFSMNTNGCDGLGPGGYNAPGMEGLDPANGNLYVTPDGSAGYYSRDRGLGADDMLATSAGLWIASDNQEASQMCGGVQNLPGICFLPYN